ncbi:hypothetical protein LDENG_00270900 [Lucifuga dentata]|nr:hypothetical protein LDENG_00270900 [Lucifuga dentata]
MRPLFLLAQLRLSSTIPSLLKYLPGLHQTIQSNYSKIIAFLQHEIEKHQEEWNPDAPMIIWIYTWQRWRRGRRIHSLASTSTH